MSLLSFLLLIIIMFFNVININVIISIVIIIIIIIIITTTTTVKTTTTTTILLFFSPFNSLKIFLRQLIYEFKGASQKINKYNIFGNSLLKIFWEYFYGPVYSVLRSADHQVRVRNPLFLVSVGCLTRLSRFALRNRISVPDVTNGELKSAHSLIHSLTHPLPYLFAWLTLY